MSLNNIAQEYFSNLNSMAARICVDMNETKAAYDNLWTQLTDDEKNQILTESIIKPEISLKYDIEQNNVPLPNHYGAKLVVDDTCSYRDEHSAPFSFRTQSQRDLTLFQGEKRLKQKIPSALKVRTLVTSKCIRKFAFILV